MKKTANHRFVWLHAIWIMCIGFVSCQSGNEILKTENETSASEEKAREDISLTKAEESIVQANNAFGFHLLQTISEEENKNLFVSPLSVTLALGMLNNGTSGGTSEEIRQVLGYTDVSNEAWK